MPNSAPRPRGQRRSKLLVPGDNWDLITKAVASDADIIHLDLEDGVSAANKALARTLVRRALDELAWREGQEPWVRIAHFDEGMAALDIEAVAGGRPNLVFMAKTQGPEDMRRLDAMVGGAESRQGVQPGAIQIGAVIERVAALASVEAIAGASPRMGALVLGVADLANEYGYRSTNLPADGLETLYLRSRMVLAARVAGITCLDAPFMSFRDLEGSAKDAQFTARLGFDGKSAISPKQIAGIHAAYAPTEAEITWARAVMEMAARAKAEDKAIFAVDGRIIELPHFIQAQRILERAAR